MLGIDLPELFVIAVVIILFADPKDIPSIMRSIAQFVRKLKSIGNEFTQVINKELEEPKGFIKDLNGKMQPTYDISDLKKPDPEPKKDE